MAPGRLVVAGGSLGLLLVVVLFAVREGEPPPTAVGPGGRNDPSTESTSAESVESPAAIEERSVVPAPMARAKELESAPGTRVRVSTRLGLPLGGLEWREVGGEDWTQVEDAGLESELVLPPEGLEVRCRAHLVATSHGEDVVLEPMASLHFSTDVEDAFTRGVRLWSATGDSASERVAATALLHGPVATGFAVAVDVPRLRGTSIVPAEYTASFSFRSATSAWLTWRPEAGVHVEEPMDAALFERAPSADLRVVPRLAWAGPEPKVLEHRLASLATGKPRVVSRAWGHLFFQDAPLALAERRSEFGPVTFARVPTGHEYEVLVSSHDGEHLGRAQFLFDGAEVQVDLQPGLRLRGRFDFGGVPGEAPARVDVAVILGPDTWSGHTWQVHPRVELSPDGAFGIPALRHEPVVGDESFPPPRTGRVRLEVVGFEPWRERVTWPADHSLLELGTISLEARAPDLALPRSALSEGCAWTTVVTSDDLDWEVLGTTSIGDADWLSVRDQHTIPFEAARYDTLLVLCPEGEDVDGVGFEREGDGWRATPGATYDVRVVSGGGIAAADQLLLGWRWRDCSTLIGSLRGAEFEDGRDITLRFRAPAQGVELQTILIRSPSRTSTRERHALRPGANVVRTF